MASTRQYTLGTRRRRSTRKRTISTALTHLNNSNSTTEAKSDSMMGLIFTNLVGEHFDAVKGLLKTQLLLNKHQLMVESALRHTVPTDAELLDMTIRRSQVAAPGSPQLAPRRQLSPNPRRNRRRPRSRPVIQQGLFYSGTRPRVRLEAKNDAARILLSRGHNADTVHLAASKAEQAFLANGHADGQGQRRSRAYAVKDLTSPLNRKQAMASDRPTRR